MNKNLELIYNTEVLKYKYQTVIRIPNFEKATIGDLIVHLFLLKGEFIEFFIIKGNSEKIMCFCELNLAQEKNASYYMSNRSNSYKLYLCEDDIDKVLHYFLIFYRNGKADVDHIDIDFNDTKHSAHCLTLIFSTKECKSGFSSDAINTIFGLK